MPVEQTITEEAFRLVWNTQRDNVELLGFREDGYLYFLLRYQERAWSLQRAGPFETATLAVSGTVTAAQGAAGTSAWLVSGAQPSVLRVTAVGAVNTAVTATLPAVVGEFHYITHLKLTKGYSVLGVAAGAGVTITSTNLPGNPAWSTEQVAGAVGTRVQVIWEEPTTPFRSSVANTATTFVAPAQLQTIWRWNVVYYTAP